jgi:vitamin B12 transporter
LKQRALTTILTSFIIFLTSQSFAQSEEEMKVLRMFYKEEELVVITSTRALKPISQVAENVSVITAKEIEDMNAHTVAEILERITGIFVDSAGHDFGSSSLLDIQGSEERHVLVLVDGIPWNFLSGGNAETNSIPIGIIQRIEIIKGPASSTWGSSLGGVINIVTKGTGDSLIPNGSINVALGERDTHDYSTEIYGKEKTFGYYLYAGRQDSDGLREGRYFKKESFYSKFNIPISTDVKLSLTAGYSEPNMRFGDLPSSNITSKGLYRTFFSTGTLYTTITEGLSFDISVYTFKQKFVQRNDVLGSAGDLYLNAVYNERVTGGSGKLVWRRGVHTVVLGADISRSELDQSINTGQLLQSFGASETSETNPEIDKWAVFANDTIIIGKFSITPGIRYDYNSVTGSFTSPSLGATYKVGENTLIRASVARGFTIPPLTTTSGGGLFFDPNPSLKPEEVWSYQAGMESSLTDYLWLKFTVFHHDMKEAIIRERRAAGAPTYNDLYLNKGDIKRQGIEFDVETIQFNKISLKTGIAYVHKKLSFEEDTTEENYAYNIGIRYDDKESLKTELFGHYIWWDLDESMMAKYDTFLWDLNIQKKLSSSKKINNIFFLTVHNIFNASYYTLGDRKNPRRWVEAGIRYKF